MNKEGDEYDISKYTDKELYVILDLNNPSDRELEARILHLINKYASMQNDSGYKLAVFFQNIYYHFFDADADADAAPEQQDIIQEGFTNEANSSAVTITTPSSGSEPRNTQIGNQLVNRDTGNTATATEIINTTNFNYTLDRFGMNPLLKQTITRIISIDSQYRNDKVNSSATNFTLNLSDPLKDVVSLSLETVNMPFSWYTISKSYGSNFFIIKGRSDEINTNTYNGQYDYKIEIPPGNYVLDSTKSNYICSAIQQSITDLSNTYTDTNFGTTNIAFNTSTIKTSLTLDIQNVYTETSFKLDFSNSIIATQFGYSKNEYTPYTIISNTRTRSDDNSRKILYSLDSSNNSFNVVQYNYDSANLTISTSDPYTSGPHYSNDNIITTIPIIIDLPDGSYSRITLYQAVNRAIQSSTFIDTSYSSLEQILDISNTEYFQMNIKLNRYKVKPVPNSKVAIIFPNEKQNENMLWTSASSCFYFKDNINETNILYAESPSIQSSISVDNSTYISFICSTPYQYASTADFSLNDIVLKIAPKDYLRDEFITTLNSFWPMYPDTFNTNMNAFIDTNDKFNLNIDILKQFDTNAWSIYIDPNSVLTQVFEISSGYFNLCDLSMINYEFKGRAGDINNVVNTYTTNILSYYPNRTKNLGNKNDISYNITTSTNQYADWNGLISEINYQLTNFKTSDLTQQFTLKSSKIDYSGNSITLKLNINYILTENNYSIYFYDYNEGTTNIEISNITNSWSNLNVDFSYNINTLPYDTTQTSRILTGERIELTPIYLTSLNNTFYITPYGNGNGGVYHKTNYFKITIPITDSNNNQIRYSTNSLITTINNIFNEDARLVGSIIIPYIKNNHLYIKLLLNINIIYTSSDYDIVFYDTVSYIKCYVGASSVKNTTWDSTLGWILGFRDYTSYSLIQENQTVQTDIRYYKTSTTGSYEYNNIYSPIFNTSVNMSSQKTNAIIILTGDTGTTTNLYNYFLLVLDDFIQNHLNDGLVCITNSETAISLPAYSANNTSNICELIANSPIIVSTVNTDGLTQKQLYAVNQAIISKPRDNYTYSNSPNVRDVFGIVSTAPSGQSPGTYYTLQGGNLQNHQRLYFGPVNISRLSIRLQTDKGDILDLNGSNWSFSLVCEQLYRNK